jgi:hypothetical protein
MIDALIQHLMCQPTKCPPILRIERRWLRALIGISTHERCINFLDGLTNLVCDEGATRPRSTCPFLIDPVIDPVIDPPAILIYRKAKFIERPTDSPSNSIGKITSPARGAQAPCDHPTKQRPANKEA